MSALLLKIIACLTMLADHIGYLLPDGTLSTVLRIIGRLAMPIFCFLIANGLRHTSNRWYYLLRLFVAALISEVPFNLCFGGTFFSAGSLNVMFTLFLGLISIMVIDRARDSGTLMLPSLIFVLIILLIAEFLSVDYGFCGVLLIVLFYFSGESGVKTKLLQTVSLLLFASRTIILFAVGLVGSSFLPDLVAAPKLTTWDITQCYSILAVLPIILYNGKSGLSPARVRTKAVVKYAFYLFYPVHLLILYFVFR